MSHEFNIDNNVLSSDRSTRKQRSQEPSLFSIGNGFIGVRGVHEFPAPSLPKGRHHTTYLNGVYENHPIEYHEGAYGYPDKSESRIAVFDCSGIGLEIDGASVPNTVWKQTDCQKSLDIKTGILCQSVQFLNDENDTISVSLERFASASNQNIVATRIQVDASGANHTVTIKSFILNPYAEPDKSAGAGKYKANGVYDPRIGPAHNGSPWNIINSETKNDHSAILVQTKNSQFSVATCHGLIAGDNEHTIVGESDGQFTHHQSISFNENSTTEVIDVITVYVADTAEPTGIAQQAKNIFSNASAEGYGAIKAAHTQKIEKFTSFSNIEIPEHPDLTAALQYNLLQLYMAVGKDSNSSIGAKGQTGEGYEGHVFWDAEIFTLPVFVFAQPKIARSMLEYRYKMLDAAKNIARTMGHQNGALFAWRTITGPECSSFFPAGSAQYHINADIAYAIQQYAETTNDIEFLQDYGLELLIETARIWPQIGFFNPAKGNAFCINCVTGPDEYSALVDNNLYTNAMAKNHLRFTIQCLVGLKEADIDKYQSLARKCALTDEELEGWREIEENMFLPYDDQRKLYLQDEHFLEKEPWDLDNTPKDQFPLLLHHHPLVIYRHQVCKQADAVLAMVLCEDMFTLSEKTKVFNYYDTVTTHDSTLSEGTFATLAAECGIFGKALSYFQTTAFLDVDNLHGNSGYGLHMAALANSWSSLVIGFGGMKTKGGRLRFSPKYYEKLGPYAFSIFYQNRKIRVSVDSAEVTYTLLEGDAIELQHWSEAIVLGHEPVAISTTAPQHAEEAIVAQ